MWMSISPANGNYISSNSNTHYSKRCAQNLWVIQMHGRWNRSDQDGRHRKICTDDGCTNIARRGGVCIRHGAKDKRCSSKGCTNQVTNGGVCVRHGAKRKLCSSEGCTNMAIKVGVCVKQVQSSNDAAAKDVQIEPCVEGCA